MHNLQTATLSIVKFKAQIQVWLLPQYIRLARTLTTHAQESIKIRDSVSKRGDVAVIGCLCTIVL